MLRLWLTGATVLACTPNRPPMPAAAPPAAAPAEAPSDRSPGPGPEAQVPADTPAPAADAPAKPPAGAPAKPPADAPAKPPAPQALTLAADAGLRPVLDVRAWDVLAMPGRIVTVDPDFLSVTARDVATAAEQWRTVVQARPDGWHTLFGLGDRIVLLAGSHRHHLDAATGKLLGSRRSFHHGVDSGCRLNLTAGERTADWSTWIPPSTAGTACAQECGCSLLVFDCSGASDTVAAFHSQQTHLYHSLGEPHDTVCFKKPGLLAAADGHVVVRVEDAKHRPIVAGLDARGFASVWSRTDLVDVSSHGDAGVDPTGRTCWLADDHTLVAFTCATGATRWRVRLAADADDPGHADVRWTNHGLLIQHRDARRAHVELRDAAGRRLWQRELPASRHALTPETPPGSSYGGAAIEAYAVLDPATGKTLGEISVPAKHRLLPAGDGFVRVGAGTYAEFDVRGKPLREAALATADAVIRVTSAHLIEGGAEQLRVLRRISLAPVLTLPGRWSLRASEAALGPDVLVLHEHRGQEAGRALVLRP